ncbi:MAG: hypothetical protein AB7O59_17540 [Pirellulales bacterium]
MERTVICRRSDCRGTARLWVGALLLAGAAGCSGIKTSDSQLFGAHGGCQSAAIAYRVERDIPRQPSGDSRLAKWLAPYDANRPPERRRTTLAVRYPHPSGRAGYARVECIVEDVTRPAAPVADDSSWLGRVRRAADEHMPGIVLADGVHEAMGLDVRIEDLAPVLARLRQPEILTTAATARVGESQANNAVVQVACTIDNAPLPAPPAAQRVQELDKLIARVRRDGSLISHDARLADPFAGIAPAPTVPAGAVFAAAAAPAPGTSAAPAAWAPVPPTTAVVASAGTMVGGQPGGEVVAATFVPAAHALPAAIASPAAPPTMWRLPPVAP